MRLIDAKQLVMHLSDYALQESPWWGANGYGNKDAYEAIEECIKAVEEAPTVEAVEVVRCKDCKHCYVDGENVRYNVCDLNHNKVQADDWFCADAEKKER